MAATAISSLSFPALGQSDKIPNFAPSRPLASAIRICTKFSRHSLTYRSTSRSPPIHCMSSVTAADDVPPVSETKSNFLKAYKRPIPSIYNTVLQELIVQQHLMRYKRTYRYDPVFALGFVTVYDQLMDGYPSDQDRDAIFKAYIQALNEDPKQYRIDAQKMEEWARSQTSASLVDFSSKEGEVESLLKDIAGRAGSKEGFSYSRFFAVGLFRLLELASATDPTVLDKLCTSLNINKKSVDRDLDVYRNLLSKLVQAKELLKEYVEREKKKQGERAESQKTNETISKCLGDTLYNPSFLAEWKA
ncbi:PREDICTED: protein THYLAKOID FORMATION 1, chloroplastic [Camelina sativa]|uniref:Protein THYLAKOID FORMATION 1, chloroplastic n=1 Tax=Camelina sativa TaxID=90675 RepID=A0ABM0W9T3_CAMSA|nr:PREDICTED: protein THYLAKOID FORMATION 1, chloroplastic [Camelina sativa]